MPTDDSPNPTFSPGRRWSILFNTVLSFLAVLALVAMLNYLASGYFKTFHWSRDASFTLSPQTLRVLESLTNDVNITMFFDSQGDNQQVYGLTKSLLSEYERSSPKHIHVKSIDYTHDVGEAKELLSRSNLSLLQEKDFVLIEANGHTKLVYARSLADYDLSGLISGRSRFVRRSTFKGEMYFTADIYAVSFPQPLKAYFLYGHGENDPGAPGEDNSKLGRAGDSKLAAMLKDQINCDWDRLSLQGTNTVPADCQLLIIAGPRQDSFLPDERDKIANYLIQGGRILALLPTDCGLEPVLRNWDVAVSNEMVMETDAKYVDGAAFFAAELFPHEIVDPLASAQISIRMVPTRPVYILASDKVPGGPEASYLAATTTNGGLNNYKQHGQYPLLVAAEQGSLKGVTSARGTGTRLVVAGDADFLDDQIIDSYAGNQLFASQALNWLLERPQLLLAGLGPQPIKEYQFYMTDAQNKLVRLLLLGAMPGGVLLLGGMVWLRRRV